jgi:hypothetical protein
MHDEFLNQRHGTFFFVAILDALIHCKLQGKNAIIPIIVYLNIPFQDSTKARQIS